MLGSGYNAARCRGALRDGVQTILGSASFPLVVTALTQPMPGMEDGEHCRYAASPGHTLRSFYERCG
ncbi:MAG: hypothetical protein BWY57_01040 [Betaproteobacteria bacterium ADurb.Bin341]|nr:MAG: hypothetical protein BWY57_01040 [Betaproteobacteria bacterium ADurb.Bin341]